MSEERNVMSEETEDQAGHKFAITLANNKTLALESELKLAEAAAAKEEAANDKKLNVENRVGMAGVFTLFGGVIATCLCGAHSAIAADFFFGGLGSAVLSVIGVAAYSHLNPEQSQCRDKAADLKLQLATQKSDMLTRLQNHAAAILDENMQHTDYLSLDHQIPFSCDDGSGKILRIVGFERGNRLVDNKPLSVAVVTAQLHSAVREEANGKWLLGEPVAEFPDIRREYASELRM